jgi:DNA-binding SARP family transcriptional activator
MWPPWPQTLHLWGYVKYAVYVPHLRTNLHQLRAHITDAVAHDPQPDIEVAINAITQVDADIFR